ncbi:MAG: arginine--tRNA ligase [Clostridia bacterium]|nr:arginine--tRNA ligase [Clostridia bacterium]
MDFKSYIAEKIAVAAEGDKEAILALIEKPKDETMGDAAFPCFSLSKVLRKAPNMIAADLAEKIASDDVIGEVSAVGGYLNFFFNKKFFAADLAEKIIKEGDSYGKSTDGEGKTVVIDFSSPNIVKPFHVGHLFSTAVGNSLSRIYDFLGYKVEKLNYLGDWGTQFGKVITAYKMWGDKEIVEKDPINELNKLYVRFHEEAEKDSSLEERARSEFHLLETGDEENYGLWNWFREVSIEEFKKVYDKMGITFDSYNGEAFFAKRTDSIVGELKEKNLLTLSEGAYIVEFPDMPPAIVLKQDGSTIYTTRDLASAEYRANTYNFDKNIYVVGLPQSLHFKQIFATLEKLGKDYAEKCTHVGFGTVKFATGAMSTRSGNVVLLETVLSEAINKTAEIMRANGNSEEDIADAANKVGIGAIFYTFLKNSREKDIIFDWDDILDFNGESGPYVQYSYARGKSVMCKAEIKDYSGASFDYDITPEEYSLCKLLSEFSDTVRAAAEKNEPFYINRYVTNVAKAFNKFYNTTPILKGDENTMKARLLLTEATTICIKNALALLGINTVERM